MGLCFLYCPESYESGMELDDIQTPGCKFPRIGKKGDNHFPDDDKNGRLSGWPSSLSRIVRVSRASGGKDRHSKVLTSKGLRDRRVRLSVGTAIQFYDLQDRLGYDQPSKAVDWLLKAADSSISELPSLNTLFPETPKQVSSEKRDSEYGNEVEIQQNGSLSRSTCSSNSETSKGSGLSLARSETRLKARERARGRAAEKEKVKEKENVNHLSRNSSLTELLTGGIKRVSSTTPESSNMFQNSHRQWSSPPMYYSGFSDQNNLEMVSPFNVTGDQQFSFVPDNLVPAGSSGGGGDYNLNFSISSGLAAYNRGTLQSNSPSLLPNMPFYIGATPPNAAPVENHHHHHQFSPGFDSGLQLFYGNGDRHSDHKGKRKN